jgi:hypothetical protein
LAKLGERGLDEEVRPDESPVEIDYERAFPGIGLSFGDGYRRKGVILGKAAPRNLARPELPGRRGD